MSDFNTWGVPFSTISFFEQALKSHKAVKSVTRQKDILFTIERSNGLSNCNGLLVNNYVLGLADIFRATAEFPELNSIITGGNWNGYTTEAKQYGLDNQIGIFIISEFFGALWIEESYKYAKKDKEGNPIYSYKTA